MFLTGTFQRSLDQKQRVAIPKRLRTVMKVGGGEGQSKEIGGVLYLAPGTDRCLAIYTEDALSTLGEQLSGASPAGQDVRAFSRLFYARAQRVEIDSQGRVRVPPELCDLVGLTKEVVLVGVRDHLELWGAESWQAYLAEKQLQYDELAEKAFEATTKP